MIPVLAACAVLTAAVVLVTGRSVRVAVQVLADLLMAAGLLNLSFGLTWPQIATAAAVVAVRKIVTSASGRPAAEAGRWPAGRGR